ncbi:MAG TPA: hypothetical protein VJ925_05740 [Longimicrobiales bacterium]|nr:hypothetical protein [Longimicrobiales bacterium]
MRTGPKLRVRLGALLVALAGTTACDETIIVGPDGRAPDAPRAFDAFYYAGAVTLSWELGPAWNGESFRVYGKRSTDPDYFSIAEVTSCGDAVCTYTDINVLPGRTYDYYVAAVGRNGVETPSAQAIRVDVPQPIPPAVPDELEAVALDNAVYLRWRDVGRESADFSFYRVYLELQDGPALIGETDSPAFLDRLAPNGSTLEYSVSSVDDQGHESGLSAITAGTPRPDFQGEVVYDWFDRPALAGFRFQADDQTNPVLEGGDPRRHFRLETDDAGWWLVPGPNARVYPEGFITTALRCGPASDAGCVELTAAPTSGYVAADVGIVPQTTYVLEVPGDDGAYRYGALRVELLGFDQDGDALMVFDWAYQLQPGNPFLGPGMAKAATP